MQLVCDQVGVVPGIDEYLSLIPYVSPSFESLIRKPAFPNLEELRTTIGLKGGQSISEKTIREKGGFPGRYPYERPSGVRYEKTDNLAQIFSPKTLEYFRGVDLPSFKSDLDMQTDEMEYVPIEVRLLLFSDRHFQCHHRTIAEARRLYSITAPTRNLFSETPSPDRTRAPTGLSADQDTPKRLTRSDDE
jgi:hypothetical protein